MSQGYEQLVAEVDRVVNSPYPTQLKQLHTIACQKCTDADVIKWTAARTCQVDALARRLMHALQQWPYVLDIITKLCVAKGVRDALLGHEPTLLAQTVARAVDGDWKHSTASLAILSHPLPPHITLPAASQTLLLGIVDHATQQPSTSSIKPIYQLLRGGLAPLLGLLSHDTLTQLERHFLAVLRNTIGQEDQCLSLYCLAIMKAIVTAAEEDPSFSTVASYETQELLASTPNSPRWKPKSMKQYFTGDKASKTLHLIVLRVLWASRATADDTIEQTVECLGLANELIMFLPESTRETWCAENPIIVRKLQEKASQSGLDTKVQLSAFAFICSLCRSRNIPETMVEHLANLLSTATNVHKQLTLGHEPSIEWFARVLDGVQLADIIISITSFAVRGTSEQVTGLAEVMLGVIECLSKSSRLNESVIDGALAALGSAAVAQDLTKLRQIFRKPSEDGAVLESVCKAAVMSGRKAIGHAICGLFLSAALAADHSQTEVASEMYPLLVETHALSVRTSATCPHVSVTRGSGQHQQGSIHVADVAFPAGTTWQSALGDHLQTKAQQEQSVLSAFFTNACADLERRCSEAEAPLREEQEKRKEVQHQYDNLYRAYTSLEDNKRRAEMRADALEAEKDEVVQDLEQAKEGSDELLARVAELEANLRENQSRAQEELEKLKQDFANAEMDSATARAQSQEHIEELEAKLSNLQIEHEKKEAANGQLSDELTELRSRKEAMGAEIHKWQTADEEHHRDMEAVEKSRKELEVRCAELLADLEATKKSMASDRESSEAHALQLEREGQEAQETLRKQHDQHIEVVNHDNRKQLDSLSAELVSAQQESRQAQANLETQLEKQEKKLADYHRKIEHLKDMCTTKDDQIAEANAMRSNLMAAMGLGKMQGSQSAKRRSTRSAVDHSEVLDNTESSVPFIDILGAARASAATQQIATQDSQAAPTPKRARSHKSVASMAPPTQSHPSTAGRATRSSTQGRSAVKRQPLLAISGNLSPSKSAHKTPRSSGVKGYDGAFDDTTFDGSEVFASTPGMHGRETEVLPEDDTEMA